MRIMKVNCYNYLGIDLLIIIYCDSHGGVYALHVSSYHLWHAFWQKAPLALDL